MTKEKDRWPSDRAADHMRRFNETLFFIFLVLKLTDTIDWSWWWVTAPLWVPLGVGVLVYSVFAARGVWRAQRRNQEIARAVRGGGPSV